MAAVSRTFRRRRIDILAGGTKQGELANQTKNNDNRIIFWESSRFALNLQIAGYWDQWPLTCLAGRGDSGTGGSPKVRTIPGINGAVSKVPCYQ